MLSNGIINLHIGFVSLLQVWMVVQRKWMYLESIFIGGDIRSQLPEEAKKFDNIDKIFKRVSSHDLNVVVNRILKNK